MCWLKHIFIANVHNTTYSERQKCKLLWSSMLTELLSIFGFKNIIEFFFIDQNALKKLLHIDPNYICFHNPFITKGIAQTRK